MQKDRLKKWVGLATAALLVLITGISAVSADTKYPVEGLVYIDENQNGQWDVNEPGYGGTLQWDKDTASDKYVGTKVTVTTPAYDEFVVNSAGNRELDKGEKDLCSYQDYEVNDKINANPKRPCSGTWGVPQIPEDTYVTVYVTPPEGYVTTSANPQVVKVGANMKPVDVGIVPTDAANKVETQASDAEVDELDEAATTTQPTSDLVVDITGFVPGLVFIDDNGNGTWEYGEAGYGGESTWVAKEGGARYIGTKVTLISPAYDKFELTSAGYTVDKDGKEVACSPQDLVYKGKVNSNPIRPCRGTWGLPGAGDDVRWEVWLTVPDGYELTSPNPQYFTTGKGEAPVDFGIVPVDTE